MKDLKLFLIGNLLVCPLLILVVAFIDEIESFCERNTLAIGWLCLALSLYLTIVFGRNYSRTGKVI